MMAGTMNVANNNNEVKVVCPSCNATVPQGKFCPECGKPLVKKQVNCIKCGKPIAEDAKFCSECGASQVVQTISCPKCGNPVKSTAKFCPECGEKIN